MLGSNSPKLLSERTADQIRLQVARGDLIAGAQLPSLRDFARLHGIAKNTVVQAYEQLVAEGVIEPRRGSGFFVTGAQGAFISAEGWAPALDHALAGVGIDRTEFHARGGRPSVGEGLPPSDWLADCRLDRYMQKIGRSGLGSVFRYGDPYGYLPLRQNIVLKLAAYGIQARPHQVILTQGAYQAIDIVIRHFVRPGDEVLMDAPGFYPTVDKLRLQGARIVGIDRTPNGPDLAQLRKVLKTSKARLFFTHSTGHNPTGSDISPLVAKELRQMLEAAGVLLVDDDALADFKPPSSLRFAALDQLARSIYVGSFSKSLSSVVRVGFMVCEASLARRLVDVKTILSLNSSPYAERTVDAVITEGRFHRHVLDLQARTREATRTSIKILKQHGATLFCEPEQTLYLWARLPGIDDSVAFARTMLEHGITLAPGAIFMPETQRPSPWSRFNVGFLADREATTSLWREAALVIRRSANTGAPLCRSGR